MFKIVSVKRAVKTLNLQLCRCHQSELFPLIDSVHKLYKFINTRPLVIKWFQILLSEGFITRANHECVVFILYVMFMAQRAQSITIINFRLNPLMMFYVVF